MIHAHIAVKSAFAVSGWTRNAGPVPPHGRPQGSCARLGPARPVVDWPCPKLAGISLNAPPARPCPRRQTGCGGIQRRAVQPRPWPSEGRRGPVDSAGSHNTRPQAPTRVRALTGRVWALTALNPFRSRAYVRDAVFSNNGQINGCGWIGSRQGSSSFAQISPVFALKRGRELKYHDLRGSPPPHCSPSCGGGS